MDSVLTKGQMERLAACILLYFQQQTMFESDIHSIPIGL
jgi:hypothetical protein